MRLEKRCYNDDDGLGMQICWGDLCYPPTSDDLTVYDNEIVLVTLGPGESTGQIAVHQFWVDGYGSEWRLYFYDLFDPSDESYIDFHIGDCLAEDMIISVEEQSRSLDFTLYPNPASEEVQVQLPIWVSNLDLTIRDLSGRMVYNQQFDGQQLSVDLGHLRKGLYLVRLSEGNNSISTKRLIVR
jgi:hypothetical protein